MNVFRVVNRIICELKEFLELVEKLKYVML